METDENIIGDLIDSYVNFKNECAVMVVALDDVVDMEETHQAYMDSVDSDVSSSIYCFLYFPFLLHYLVHLFLVKLKLPLYAHFSLS